ncbi:MAG: hypothetical protein KJO60_03440 [Desulfofustis sp.]|nr:hypothetical protein [Desulfofustis sp.]
MSEPITFFSESFRGDTTYYDVHENGMVCRSDSNDEKNSFVWSNVKFIEDRSHGWIYIVLNNLKEIPIKYTTNEFPILLKTVCLRLSDIRKGDFRDQNFRLTPKYLFQLRVVISILVLALIVSLPLSNVLFLLLLTLIIPLWIFFQRQPISLALDNQCLTVHYLHKKIAINYPEILNADFEVMNNDYGSTLGILINLKDRKDITIRKLEDIIIFFIMLQIKLNENINVH